MFKLLLFFLLFVFSNAGAFDFFSISNNDSNVNKINRNYKYNLFKLQVKQEINKIFEKYKEQSVVDDKNIIYYRPDKIYRTPPKVYRIWTRASVTEIDNGKFYYIIPEGYRIVYEKEGELFIDYEPNPNILNKEPLNIINMNEN